MRTTIGSPNSAAALTWSFISWTVSVDLVELQETPMNARQSASLSRLTQSYLLLNFVALVPTTPRQPSDDAKRPANIEFFVRRAPTDALRRPGVDAAFLQTASLEAPPAALRPTAPPRRRLLARRPDPGAVIGYNPKKHGRRSYHPLRCFEAQRQEFWHGSLRPGDAAANTGVVPFLRRRRAKVPPTIAASRIRVRADAGYFSGKSVGFLDQAGLGYVIVAREYRGIQQRAQAARFQKLRFGWEVGEFCYTPTRWAQPHRQDGEGTSVTQEGRLFEGEGDRR
jgi:hypothetical protein